ncbi:MAG: hypothetical protein SFY67_08285 [Candidatus Melainabacteria bacterium]|nr:hypothetical protein [Candidatus Melainabacteria bacterium]
MTRAFAFKLFFLSEIIMAFTAIGVAALAALTSSSLWSMLILLPIWLFLLVNHKAGCRELKSIKFLDEAYKFSPVLATIEKWYFWAYSSFLTVGILCFLCLAPVFIDFPVLIVLSEAKQFEMAERIHSLDYSFGGVNRYPAAIIYTEAKKNMLSASDWQMLENVIVKVHGDASIQHGFWLRFRGNDSKNSVSDRRRSLLRAMECFGKLKDEASLLLSEINLAQFEAEHKNFDTATQILCQSLSKIELVSQKLSPEKETSILEALVEVHHELGNYGKEKALNRRLEQKRKLLHQSYLFGFGFLPFVERLVTITTVILGAIAIILSLIFGIVLEVSFWRNKRVLKFAKSMAEIEAALNFLIPVAMYKRKQALAEEYSLRLLEISEAK